MAYYDDVAVGEEEELAPEVIMEFRPTLIIGLGGTGHEVLVRLKARFLDTYGEKISRVIKLISFDTADESIDVVSEKGRLVSLTKDV